MCGDVQLQPTVWMLPPQATELVTQVHEHLLSSQCATAFGYCVHHEGSHTVGVAASLPASGGGACFAQTHAPTASPAASQVIVPLLEPSPQTQGNCSPGSQASA